MPELVNSLPLLVSLPIALVGLALFVVVAAGAAVASRAFSAPERPTNGRSYF